MRGAQPSYRTGLLAHYPSFSLLTLPGDAQTWSVPVFMFSGDAALKTLRDPNRRTTLGRACPLHAHWIDGEAITEVLPMGGVTDHYRRFVVDGAPVATEILSVGDAWACTNPVNGRGISMGLMHAEGTAEVMRAHPDDPLRLACAHDAMTETRATPWYRDTMVFDRARTADRGRDLRQEGPAPIDPRGALALAMQHGVEVFCAFLEINSLLALPQDVFAGPGVADRIMEVAAAHPAVALPCPPRDELLRLLA